jgi:hypothetical protein
VGVLPVQRLNAWVNALTSSYPPPKSNGHDTSKSRHAGTWIYNDAEGKPYLKVERFDKLDGSKRYPQSHRRQGVLRRVVSRRVSACGSAAGPIGAAPDLLLGGGRDDD